MVSSHPVDRLAELSRTFGPASARDKLALLAEISRLQRHRIRRLRLLHDTLYYMRAYPDNPSVLHAVIDLSASLAGIVDECTNGDPEHAALINSGLPGSSNHHSYAYDVLERLVELFPGCLSINWDEITYEPTYVDALNLTVLPGESRGLEDEFQGLRDWLDDSRTDSDDTDLEVVLRLFGQSSLSSRLRAHIFDACEYPVVYRLTAAGSARCDVVETPDEIYFQSKPLEREKFRLKPKILEPIDRYRHLSPKEGRHILDLALRALCSRNLEIHPLIYANSRDVVVADGGRGLRFVLAGVVPEFRATLESDFFFLIMKNGVPIAYGPTSVFLGCCEMGINLFPEFRRGEIRYIYSQFMRVLHHVAEVRYFFLTSYGMGDGNPEALRSGAFWFYRKLGFRAADPDIEALARREEKIMRRKPRYRSSLATLKELALTDAYFDLSGGVCSPVCFEDLGHAVSRAVNVEFRGNRRQAERAWSKRLLELLDVTDFNRWKRDEKIAYTRMAPVLVQIRKLRSWPAGTKASLVRAVRTKGGVGELEYVGEINRVDGLQEALHDVSARK
jgi:hypothetical protein